MRLKFQLQNKNIYSIDVDDTFITSHKIDKETISIFYLKNILDDFTKRLPKQYSLIKFTEKVFDESMQKYETTENYEECAIIKQMKDVLCDLETRQERFKTLLTKISGNTHTDTNSPKINEK